MKKDKIIFRVISLALIFGGLVRLIATESIFELFGMASLWTDHSYFKYIYKVLGAFVIFMGMLMFSISRDIEKYIGIFNTFKWGFVVIGLTMLITGYLVHLPLVYYAPDFIFCFTIVIYLQIFIIFKKN